MGKEKICLFILIFFNICCKKNENFIPQDLNSRIDILVERSKDESQPKYVQKTLTDSLLMLVNLQPKSYNQRNYLFKIASRYYNLREHKLEKVITQRIISESLEAHDSTSLAKGYEYLADYYEIIQLSDSAVINYRIAKDIYTTNRNK